jgi:preprotein translocase subunit SecG
VSVLVTFVTICHVFIAIILVIAVLLQPGKGGDLGSMFGGGMSESIFGSSGAVPFLTKITRVLAILFILSSLSLGYFSTRGLKSSVVEDQPSIPIHDEFEVLPGGDDEDNADISSTVDDKQEKTLTEDVSSGDVPEKNSQE